MSIDAPNVIAISYAKRALIPDSRDRLRMREYATVLGSFHLIVLTRDTETPAMQEEGNLFLYSTHAASKLGMVWRAFLIGRSIIKKHPKTVFVLSGQDPFETSLITLALSFYRNTRLHVQVHGDVFNSRYFKGSITRFVKGGFAAFVLKRAEKVRVVSERIKASLARRGVNEARIAVVPIQSDLERFLAVGEERHYSTDVSPTCLYVGRFSHEKNLSLLINAFSRVFKEVPEARLQLLGDGPLKSQLEAQVARLGLAEVVQFIPWTDDVSQYMATANILCLASDHEGFAMVLVEAMAAGLAIVTTDVGCVGEWVREGEEGLVVPAQDLDAYATALTHVCTTPALHERLGRTGHVSAQKRFTPHAAYLHAIQDSFTV